MQSKKPIGIRVLGRLRNSYPSSIDESGEIRNKLSKYFSSQRNSEKSRNRQQPNYYSPLRKYFIENYNLRFTNPSSTFESQKKLLEDLHQENHNSIGKKENGKQRQLAKTQKSIYRKVSKDDNVEILKIFDQSESISTKMEDETVVRIPHLPHRSEFKSSHVFTRSFNYQNNSNFSIRTPSMSLNDDDGDVMRRLLMTRKNNVRFTEDLKSITPRKVVRFCDSRKKIRTFDSMQPTASL